MMNYFRNILSNSTKSAILYDILRFKTRIKNRRTGLTPKFDKLHLGCGKRKVEGWLNVDLVNSDFNVDLAIGKLPWKDNVFKSIVSQHVIEHLHLEYELLPLLTELSRVIKPDGEIWISTPDLEKVCNSYLKDKAENLIKDRKTRFKNFDMNDIPSQHFINKLFHQEGQHKNLFDFEMIKWMLMKNNFINFQRVAEKDLLKSMPEFPIRNDDEQSVYVKAKFIDKKNE